MSTFSLLHDLAPTALQLLLPDMFADIPFFINVMTTTE